MESVKRSDPVIFTSAQLNLYTKNFDEENFIGPTLFGKLYRGKILHGLKETGLQNVIVKIWKIRPAGIPHQFAVTSSTARCRVRDEVYFLQHPSVKNHPNLVKLIGYCCEVESELFAVVYDLNPVDTLYNLICEGSFDWLQRIKVALGFARLLAFLHDFEFPYMVRNIEAAHIMIDKDYNPILLDFGLLSGGFVGDSASCPYQISGGIYGHICYVDSNFLKIDVWRPRCDVYSYGILVVSMISKIVADEELHIKIGEWAEEKIPLLRKHKFSLVHQSLEKDPNYDASDGIKITKLALNCLDQPQHRSTMKQVVEVLQELWTVKKHREFCGINTRT